MSSKDTFQSSRHPERLWTSEASRTGTSSGQKMTSACSPWRENWMFRRYRKVLCGLLVSEHRCTTKTPTLSLVSLATGTSFLLLGGIIPIGDVDVAEFGHG